MNHDDLIRKLTALARPRVLLVGDFMLDEYIYGDAERISPEAPVPVLRVVDSNRRAGGAGGVAANLAALGADAVCIGVVGDDEPGRRMLDELKGLGCDVSGMVTTPDRPTTCKTRLVGLAQHRHRQQLMRVDREDGRPLDDATRQKLLTGVTAALDTADVLLLQDYNKGVLTADLVAELAAAAKQRGVAALVDPARIDDYARYRGATAITPNRWEASLAGGEQIAEVADGDTTQLQRVAERLIAAADLEQVVITLDREGAYLADAGGGQLVPTRPRNVYDVTGAGDMVLAVLGLCWPSGRDDDFTAREAVMMANLAGGLEVEKFGSVPVSRNELLSELHHSRQGASKLWDLPHLAEELARQRDAGRVISFTNGCFDILHPGHVTYLQFARDQGDLLVVGLNSDASVRRNKGDGRPICTQDERAAVLGALACVDYVVLFDEDTPWELINAVRPDRLVKGRDWEGNVVGSDIVEARGGRVVLADLVEGKSTTDIVARIIAAHRRASSS